MNQYKYSLVRYYADAIRDEPVNVGLVLHSVSERHLAFRFDLRRVAAKVTKSDKETFKHFEEVLEPIENEEVDWEAASFENVRVNEAEFLAKLADYLGNKIRFTAPRGCISDNPDETFGELFVRFVSAGRGLPAKVTKRTVVNEVKQIFVDRGVGEYLKSRPTVMGEHKNYTLPLGVRHSHRTFVEVLKLGEGAEKNYRAMAAVGRLWQDAKKVLGNRQADLLAVVRYTNGRIREGEQILKEDGVRVLQQPGQVLARLDFGHLRAWD